MTFAKTVLYYMAHGTVLCYVFGTLMLCSWVAYPLCLVFLWQYCFRIL